MPCIQRSIAPSRISLSPRFLPFLSYFPLTAFAAMPVKMALIDLPLWQPLLSLSLTLILCFWIRTAAGNLFKMGMSMYGKEPSLKDMMMWMLRKS